ncbi:hypothetical protein [Xanthobacter autotrophicus]|uniref:hypothetical protein n=1 Tax=Xanthobacter autotrophicus TaxID=280 RepID=UPI0024A76C66|nr:hypothetical protein [Xanthobacter autotrophicus]MDI4655047.1 hypothetical protein [Xanthobacter autotrophicus]
MIVGTMGDETAPEERGKILGLMEPTTLVVSSLDYDLARGPRDFDEEGHYRWPYGLELRHAWRFEEPRATFAEISARRFSMDSAQGIVPLLAEEADQILRLKREAVSLLRPVRAEARVIGADAARRRAAPPPTTTRRGIMHLRRAPAFTYAMAIEGVDKPAFKIGWAFDWKIRERQFNQASMPTLGGLRYRVFLHELWDTAILAFGMEQSLLRRFDTNRHDQNREILTPVDRDQIQAAWIDCLLAHRRKR